MFSNLSNVYRDDNKKNSNQIMMMGFTRNNSRIYNQPVKQEEKSIQINPSDANVMTWGAPTWYFLHTLAEKIHENEFALIRSDLLNIIYMIISNLPCPLCSEHGKTFLKSINFDNIQGKDDLKRMLFDFHNLVNTRKHFALFSYDELNDKYSKAITVSVFQNFMYYFSKKSGNIRLISEDLHRQVMLKTVKEFLQSKIIHFDK